MAPVLPIVSSATADANGDIAFSFEPVGPDTVMQGTVAVPTAPVAAHFIANVSGTAVGAFDGYNPWGPVQVPAYQQLTLSGSGLRPNATYQAVWMAAQYPPNAAPVPPTPYGSATTLTGPVDANITGPVDVSGTVDIGNSPTVEIAAGATIGISGTPTVDIGNSPTVDIASGATVGISGTPTVVIEPGTTVNITGPVSLSQGSQLTNSSGVSVQGIQDQLTSADLGDGLDGNVTITASATLIRDMQYSSLVVNSGVVLTSGGYVIRCTGTVTVNGTIDNSGQSAIAGSSTPALGGLSGTLPGGANGVVGGVGIDVISSASVGGGPGGSATTPAGVTYRGGSVPATSPTPLTISSSRTTVWAGGASGGTTVNSGVTYADSGGGGGVVVIVCGSFAGSGTVSANAGSPAIVSNETVAVGGSGGGIVFIATLSSTFSGVLSATGSAGLATSGSGYTATKGGPGRTALVVSG